MKRAGFIGLLVYVTLVSAHPFSPYTDNEEESESMEWSQEAVAAFLKNKMEKENLQPASLSEYLLTLMQGSKKKPGIIRNGTNTSTGTNKSKLMFYPTLILLYGSELTTCIVIVKFLAYTEIRGHKINPPTRIQCCAFEVNKSICTMLPIQ